MAEEQMLSKCEFPGGSFHSVVPWASTLQNELQEKFSSVIKTKKNKTPNLFHLLGWEASIVTQQLLAQGPGSLPGFSYDSPRGKTTIHPGTHYTYAPLYKAVIKAGADGKCILEIENQLTISAEEHLHVLSDKPDASSVSSGWKNNYLCI
jgi:branched-chain amino acid transport system substrate-binding protein